MSELAEIEARLDRISRGPGAIKEQLFFRVARPILAVAGWRAQVRARDLTALIELFQTPQADRGESAKKALAAAARELEANVDALERVVIVRRRVPVAHVGWLRRAHAVLSLAEAALSAPPDDPRRRAVASADPSALLPPLVPLRDPKSPLEVPIADHPEVEDAPLVDLELAAIDHLIAAARAESLVLGRRRRLFVAARQRLLEASAALPLERAGVRARATYLAREITRIDRLEAAGLATDVSLLHQARQALTRRDPKRLAAALRAIDHHALAGADLDVAKRTGRVLRSIVHGADEADAATMAALASASLAASGQEVLGEAAALVASAVEQARGDANDRLVLGGLPSDRQAARELLAYLPEGAEASIVRAAIAADGFFEVGGALAPIRIEEEERIRRVVRHPTQNLHLLPAEDVSDLRDAVIGDPRSVLLDLATGRLFARRFVREEVRRRPRTVLQAEVRVYVLDGSGSMVGPRARVRDAILVAELSTLMRRLEAPGDTRSTLIYRYFDEELGLEVRVDSVVKARDAIRDVVGRKREGGTDIEKALLASLEHVAAARASDPELARAQIVLVTDGEAAVDEHRIVRARDTIAGLPVGVSVIALGAENPALRGLVARQRAKGEAAFYHYLADDELAAITGGPVEEADAIHAPDRWTALAKDPSKLAAALDDEVGGLLEELAALDRERDHAALERLEEEAQARREVGLDDAAIGDGERARIEALRRDRVALEARYRRWFPDPATAADGAPEAALAPPLTTREDAEAARCALASVAEVVGLLGGSPILRQADAIELLERLLADARLSPGRYRAVLRERPAEVRAALEAVRDAVKGPTG